MTHWCTTRNGFTVDEPDTTPRKVMSAPITTGLFREPVFTDGAGDAPERIWDRQEATLYPTMGSASSRAGGPGRTRGSLSRGDAHA